MNERPKVNPSGVLNLAMGNASIRLLRRNGELAYYVTYPDGSRGTVIINFDPNEVKS